MDKDLIDRQAAIDALGNEPEVWSRKDEYAQGLNNQWHYDVNALKAVPSAERHGSWKTLKGCPNVLLCSECDTPYEKKEFAITPNYCYNCGARMINENE